jgi:hypothetical protein
MRNLLFEDSIHPYVRDGLSYKFDDTKVIMISKMLEHYLSSDNVSVLFTNSSNKIYDNIVDNIGSKPIIVYYDLVYDNPETISKLGYLMDLIVEHNYNNVYLVPIHCIEWHAINAFGKESELKDIVVNCKPYKNTQIFKNNVNARKASFEKFCKAALGELVDRKYLGICSTHEYNISCYDEDKLVKTLPVTYTDKGGYHYVNIVDLLRNRYKEFVDLFVCRDALKQTFIGSMNKYLNFVLQ